MVILWWEAELRFEWLLHVCLDQTIFAEKQLKLKAWKLFAACQHEWVNYWNWKKRVKFHGKQSANDECKEQLITLRDPLKIIQEFVGTLNSFPLFISDLSTLCGKVSSDCRYSMPLIASFINYWTALSCSSERKNRFIAQKTGWKIAFSFAHRLKNAVVRKKVITESITGSIQTLIAFDL